jgi:hypothetical protein
MNAAYNCESGENTERAIGEMTDSINKAKDDANEKIQENRKRAEEAELRAREYYVDKPRFNEFYDKNPGYQSCFYYAIDYRFGNGYLGSYPDADILAGLQSRFYPWVVTEETEGIMRVDEMEGIEVREVPARCLPGPNEHLIAYIGNLRGLSNATHFHYMRYNVGIGLTQMTNVNAYAILKFKGNPWDYPFIRDEYAVCKQNAEAEWIEWEFERYYIPELRYFIWKREV